MALRRLFLTVIRGLDVCASVSMVAELQITRDCLNAVWVNLKPELALGLIAPPRAISATARGRCRGRTKLVLREQMRDTLLAVNLALQRVADM